MCLVSEWVTICHSQKSLDILEENVGIPDSLEDDLNEGEDKLAADM